VTGRDPHRARGPRRAAAERPYDPSPGRRDPHLWGYRDTRFEFVDARTVRFPVEVAAEGEATLRYEVRYSW